MKELIIEATINALKLARNVRFFRTERGYQGELFCELKNALYEKGIIEEDLILEMEYQKVQDRHRTRRRPDIILHVPAEVSDAPAHENNIGVWALKHNASMLDAQNDFNKLDEMFRHLNYFLGFFINIDSNFHHLELYSGNYKDRIFAFAVNLSDNTLHIKQASFIGGKINEEVISP